MFTVESDMLSTRPPNIAVITCDVLRDEICQYSHGLDHIVHIEVLKQGLHNYPPLLQRELQSAVDRIETQFQRIDAIALGYGLCSRGVEGVIARRCKLVMVRAHDCITLLLGDRQRYAQYVSEHPGTYWYSPGWNRCHLPPGPQRHEKLLNEYIQKYGEEDAQFLMESEQSWFSNYDRATFVDLGTPNTSADVAHTQDCAKWLGWNFDRQHGSPQLLVDLLSGNWDQERFLVLEPGQSVQMTADEKIVRAVTINGGNTR
jgi:Protein of unknown function (DUF1638)